MPTPYQEALARINTARESGATKLDLSGLGLDVLPPELYLSLEGNPLESAGE